MRMLLVLLCVLGIPCASLAQTNQASWATLSGLRAGQNIQIVDTASKKHSGTFTSVSDTAISFRATAGEQSIQKQDVRSIRLMKNTHRLRNTLIVAGVGAGVGAGIGAATYKPCSQEPFCLDIGGRGLPTAIGAGDRWPGWRSRWGTLTFSRHHIQREFALKPTRPRQTRKHIAQAIAEPRPNPNI